MDPNTPTPLEKALRYAALLTGLAVFSFILLIIVALYVPENYLLNSRNSGELQEWLPAPEQIPADMLLVANGSSDNEDIASNYQNRAEMLKLLEGFGRVEGVMRSYVSRDRCQMDGPRSLEVSLVSHKTAEGARDYWQWMRERDTKNAQGYQELQIGDGGYLFWVTIDNPCPGGEQIRKLEISFHRNQYLATIQLSTLNRQNQLNQILSLGIEMAKVFDRQLQGAATAQK